MGGTDWPRELTSTALKVTPLSSRHLNFSAIPHGQGTRLRGFISQHLQNNLHGESLNRATLNGAIQNKANQPLTWIILTPLCNKLHLNLIPSSG